MTTATVARSGGFDAYGDPVADAETAKVRGVFVAPATSEEIEARGRAGIVAEFTLFAPPGADIRHADTVTVDGVAYEVAAEPSTWTHPRAGRGRGVVVPLRRTAG